MDMVRASAEPYNAVLVALGTQPIMVCFRHMPGNGSPDGVNPGHHSIPVKQVSVSLPWLTHFGASKTEE